MHNYTWTAAKLLLHAASPIQRIIDHLPADTHIFFNRQAVKILYNDGYQSISRYLSSQLEIINSGVIWADKNWKNFAHYFNPLKNRGIWPWPDARSECRNYYKKALTHWQQGMLDKSMFFLGAAVHLVQDMCNPYHARCVALAGHSTYERWAQHHHLKYAVNDGGIYHLSAAPEYWINLNAKLAWLYYPNISSWRSEEQYHRTSAIVLPQAQRSSAGFFLSFIKTAAQQ